MTLGADPLSRVFSALADPIRRDMVARLAEADATVTELAEPYDVTIQAVSKHLKVLEDAGLVSRSRDAQRRPVHLEADVLDLMTKWVERYRRQAEERYRRLDDLLARMPDHLQPIPSPEAAAPPEAAASPGAAPPPEPAPPEPAPPEKGAST
ncbi:MAG: metalloregulator ArsR/SmtB family transcription factor [Actinomycetota bacterium]|nr:metalloregulator ArsR/SmtB family transcription factor [Actinomycetota bacterium]